MPIDQCASPKAFIILHTLHVWASNVPWDQTYITYTSVTQYRAETRAKWEVWSTFLSSNQPLETSDWVDGQFNIVTRHYAAVQGSQEWGWENGDNKFLLFTSSHFYLYRQIPLAILCKEQRTKGKAIQHHFWRATVLQSLVPNLFVHTCKKFGRKRG